MVKGRKAIEHPVMVASVLEEQEKKMLEDIGWRERLSTSEIARKAIIEYIKAHGEGNDTYPLEKWQQDPNFKAVPALLSPLEDHVTHYRMANDKDKTTLRTRAMDLLKKYRMVDVNEMRKM